MLIDAPGSVGADSPIGSSPALSLEPQSHRRGANPGATRAAQRLRLQRRFADCSFLRRHRRLANQ